MTADVTTEIGPGPGIAAAGLFFIFFVDKFCFISQFIWGHKDSVENT